MAKNNKYWKSFAATAEDRKLAKAGTDPLEEGLKDLGWFANSRRLVRQKLQKTRESFGEEVGNSITSGIFAAYLLGMLPFASVTAYLRSNGNILSVVGLSAFVIGLFLALLITTIYHFMKHGTNQKRIMHKINRISIYYAILGGYTPVCIAFLNPVSGAVIFALEAALAVAGTLVTALTYPKYSVGTGFANFIFYLMAWLILFDMGEFHRNADPRCFWLIISGLIVFTVGTIFYSGKRFKFSHMVWHFFVLAGGILHVLGFVYFFG